MDVLVAGGHGQIARQVLAQLVAGGHRARGLIRNPEHAADLEALGAEAVVVDLEREDVSDAVRGANAIVFAAGAGPGSGPERKRTVDLGGAVKLIRAAGPAGVARYLMVSAMGAADPASGGEQMRSYLEAKAEADTALRDSGLDFTIVRPGALTNDPGTGNVELGESLGRRGEIAREDVAAVLVAALTAPNAVRRTFEVLAGETPVADAIRAL